MCQERLDLDLPLSVQPNDGIEEIVSACLHKFPGVEADLARRRVRIFLKNSRKGKRKPSTGQQTLWFTISCVGLFFSGLGRKSKICIKSQVSWANSQTKMGRSHKVPKRARRISLLIILIFMELTDKGLNDDPDDVYHPPPRKRRGRKRGGGGDPDLPPSQWSVLSLTEFLNYNCPACDFKCKDQAKFLEHAYETHVDSVKYLCSGMTSLAHF